MPESKEEKDHWQSVLRSFDGYMQYHLSANHARRMAFLQLPKEQRAIYETIGFREKLDAVDEGIRRNAEFIDEMIRDPVFADMLDDDGHGHGHDHGHDHSHDHTHNHPSTHSHQPKTPKERLSQGGSDLAQDKVRSTLRSMVRDWAKEGAKEREACYDPIIKVLESTFPDKRGEKKVLVPGCGLGRLAMEIASKGFFSQGNEFSTYMLIASHYILNQSDQVGEHDIFPYLHSYSNHLSTERHLLKRISIPDVLPSDVLSEKSGEFSLVAGDFEEIYGESSWTVAEGVEDGQGQRGKWSAVVTCFFIDCARNVLNFLRIIHNLLEKDGIWINLGPLLWHFENSPIKGPNGDGSIELSLDEVKELARIVGFHLREERTIETTYTGIQEGMLQHRYNAAFWVATKRDV